MQKGFSHHSGKHIFTWLLRCWDSGASSLESEDREAKQLGSLAREGGIDKVIGKKGTSPQPLEVHLLSGEKERNPFTDIVVCYPGERTMNAQLPTDPHEVQRK